VTDRFRVVPAAYVVLRRDGGAGADGVGRGQVLLQLRRGTGYMDGHWATAAAGHVEEGEPVFAAACREAAEELDVRIDPGDLTPITVMHRTQGNHLAVDERVDFFFECRRWQGDPRLVEPDKAADLRWFALDALPEPLVPHERYVYEALLGGELPGITAYGF